MTSLSFKLLSAVSLLCSLRAAQAADKECFEDPEFNEFFATDNPTCCQNDVCLIPCPEPVSDPSNGRSYTEFVYEEQIIGLFRLVGSCRRGEGYAFRRRRRGFF